MYSGGTSEKDCAIYWVRFDKLLESPEAQAIVSECVRQYRFGVQKVVLSGSELAFLWCSRYLVNFLFSFRGVSEVEVPADRIHAER